MPRPSPFDVDAERYDSWFESCEGGAIFEIENTCLRTLLQACKGRWLEVGVGSGRFAAALGIAQGLDPSSAMLAIATRRGILAVRGVGEDLPYQDATFDGVLMVTTLCFLSDAERTLSECHRVLRPRGSLLVGIVPAESAWGRLYMRKGRERHPLFSEAKFYTCEQVVRICADAGFILEKAVSCLQTSPGEEPIPGLEEGINESAGFVAMRFNKT
jgi:ubiquinone/menaquinone biosynthesis C-methylase UbiE